MRGIGDTNRVLKGSTSKRLTSMNKVVACAVVSVSAVVPGSLGASDPDGSRTNYKKRTAGVAFKTDASNDLNHSLPEPSSKKAKKDETVKLIITTSQFSELKAISDYFDNDTLLETNSLSKTEGDDYLYSGKEEQCDKLSFLIKNLDNWKTNQFELESSRIQFISYLTEFQPKENINKIIIERVSISFPQIIESYVRIIPNLGEETADKIYFESFLHIKTIFQDSQMITKVLNKMDFSGLSEDSITTLATLFFYGLDEINLMDASLSKDQFNALVSGIVASKEMVKNAPKLTKIVLGHNVTCDNDTMKALAKKAQSLNQLFLGHNVTCDNDTMKALADKAQGLHVLVLGNNVTCDNDTMKALADKAQSLKVLQLGHNVTCDNDAIKALAAKAQGLHVLFLGRRVTCNNDTMKVLAAKAQGLHALFLGNNVTCNNDTMKALADKAQGLKVLELGRRVTCDSSTRQLFFQNNRSLNQIIYHNQRFNRNHAL